MKNNKIMTYSLNKENEIKTFKGLEKNDAVRLKAKLIRIDKKIIYIIERADKLENKKDAEKLINDANIMRKIIEGHHLSYYEEKILEKLNNINHKQHMNALSKKNINYY